MHEPVLDNDSLYARYMNEVNDAYVLTNKYGFAVYKFLEDGKSVYITDIYVQPNMRESGIAAKLADTIVEEAKKRGCTELIGTIVPSRKVAHISLKFQLAYGMRVSGSSNDVIFLKKDI